MSVSTPSLVTSVPSIHHSPPPIPILLQITLIYPNYWIDTGYFIRNRGKRNQYSIFNQTQLAASFDKIPDSACSMLGSKLLENLQRSVPGTKTVGKRSHVPRAHPTRIIEYLGISYRSVERVSRICVPNEGWHTLTAPLPPSPPHDGNWIKPVELFARTLHTPHGGNVHNRERRHNAPRLLWRRQRRKSFSSFKGRDPRIDTIHAV